MLNISGKTIRINRGDAGTLALTIPISDEENYTFNIGDKIQFRIFEKKGYNKDIVLEKVIEVEEETEIVDISLTEADTLIGEDINKEVIYWYEIALNEEQTVIGYDENGAAELILYPAKGGK